jgi:hypothetical protein
LETQAQLSIPIKVKKSKPTNLIKAKKSNQPPNPNHETNKSIEIETAVGDGVNKCRIQNQIPVV